MRRPKINEDLAKSVQEYANRHLDGNFTKAVNELLETALNCDASCTYLPLSDIRYAQRLKNLQAAEIMENSVVGPQRYPFDRLSAGKVKNLDDNS